MKFHSQSKRILSLVMAVCLMLTAFGNTVSAASSEDGFTYEALNGTYCTVTGYTGTDTDVVIPSSSADILYSRSQTTRLPAIRQSSGSHFPQPLNRPVPVSFPAVPVLHM